MGLRHGFVRKVECDGQSHSLFASSVQGGAEVANAQLHITVWDHDLVGTDFLGEVLFALIRS